MSRTKPNSLAQGIPFQANFTLGTRFLLRDLFLSRIMGKRIQLKGYVSKTERILESEALPIFKQ